MIIEEIKKRYPLAEYIENRTGLQWKAIGSWRTLEECPVCGGHGCFRISNTDAAYCFQCYSFMGNAVQARMLIDRLEYKEAIAKFKEEMGIRKSKTDDVEWVSIRELACEYLREILFTSQTKYQFRHETLTPLEYMIEYRKHSHEAILNFRIGFNDGGLIEHLKEKGYSEQAIKATGIDKLPDKCFIYPFIVDNEIKYFRIKDPNKIKKWQMPISVRSKDAVWFNQDVIKQGEDLFLCEGEDDVISLWDAGISAVACCGTLTPEQVNFLKDKEIPCIFLCFDNDNAGIQDVEKFIRNYNRDNIFLVEIPKDKDVDEILRDAQDSESAAQELRRGAKAPKAELRSIIRHKEDGYYIVRKNGESRLSNWTIILEAVIIKGEEDRVRQVKLKSGNYFTTVKMPSIAFANTSRLREFLNSVSDKLLWFTGTDTDLANLVQYFDLVSDPKIVRETDHVGEIEEGFIAENIFVSNANDFRPLTDGFLSIDDKRSIRIAELVRRGSSRSEVPYFNLVEPAGGIDAFKEYVFGLLIKNRNLKMAMAIGWMKATLWSGMFYDKRRFFPILAFHGKFAGGKSLTSQWMMSLMGMRDCNPEMLSDKGTTEVGLGRKFSYYSSLPIFVDDYRNDESGQRFHTFFRGVFDRSSPTKGIKQDFGVRRVAIRGCLLLNGENCPQDPALLSRMISIELTLKERKEKYFKEIMKVEPQFACIGLDWVKNRIPGFEAFMNKFNELDDILRKEIEEPRQAAVMAVCVASCMTEPYFKDKEEALIDFAVAMARDEAVERKNEEVMGTIWDAVDVLHKKNLISDQLINYVCEEEVLQVFMAGIMAEISGNQFTRQFKIPNKREVLKIFKQEPYVLMNKSVRVGGKVARRWILDLKQCPEVLRDMYSEDETKEQLL